MASRIIDWRFIPNGKGWDVEDDEIIWLDVAAFDRAWQRSDQYIVPGGANGQDERYPRIGKWFAAYYHCDMAFVSLDDDIPIFTNGRHRYSWLRDHGVTAMPFQVSPGASANFGRLFPTHDRSSILRDSP